MAYNYSCADWNGLYDHLRNVPWEDIFKLSASVAAKEFCERVQVVTDAYIPHCKYQVKINSSQSGPFRRFLMRVWQNACVDTARCAMVCDVYFPFSKIVQLY